jgi:hypothetical protein
LVKKPLNKLRTLILVLIAVILIAAGGFVVWALTPLGPMDEALLALESSSEVSVAKSSWLEFHPENTQAEAGFVFYPGGRVDHRSYAPFARQIAQEGYLVVIVPMPLNLAVFSPNRAGQVIQAHPEIENWAIGGHSLGGAMAASFTGSNPGLVRGLAFWASYPPSSTDLTLTSLTVVSIYGSRDSVLSQEQFEKTRTLLPENTEWVLIEGGNHAQFGWYGPQPGDGEAAISRIEQQNQVVSATLQLLEHIQSQR